MSKYLELKLNYKMKMEDALSLAQAAALEGYDVINITGDEPLERFNLIKEIETIKAMDGVKKVMITTDGQMLAHTAEELKKAGLDQVQVKVDTFRYARFKKRLEDDTLENVVAGINAATTAGLKPVRIAVRVEKDVNDDEIMDFVQLTFQHEYEILFIGTDSISADDIKKKLPALVMSPSDEHEVSIGKYPGALGRICFEK